MTSLVTFVKIEDLINQIPSAHFNELNTLITLCDNEGAKYNQEFKKFNVRVLAMLVVDSSDKVLYAKRFIT